MAVIATLLTGLLLTPLAIAVSHRVGALDHPGHLKVHDRPVPFVGGIAAFGALAVPVGLTRPAYLLPLGAALALGTVDDLRHLSARVRLVAEVGIGVGVALLGPGHGVLDLLWPIGLTLVLINAVNLLDGLDGLASGVTIASCLGFAVLLDGDGDGRTLALCLAAAVAAVLVWNRPPARVYLGDGGSYLIGTALAILLAEAFRGGADDGATWAAALLVGVPVADTTVAIVRRFRAGRPLLAGDRGHLYDQLMATGVGAPSAALICIAGQAALSVTAIGLAQTSAGIALAATAAVIVGVGGYLLVRFTAASTWT